MVAYVQKPIIIVTGANGGVGFGICQRLLLQLSQRYPTDALPQAFAPDAQDTDAEIPTYEGLTLIMACRSTKRGEVARRKLQEWFDALVDKLGKQPGYDGHAHKFRQNVDIEVHYVDLASISSVFRFADSMSHIYPYISHLICNAGGASFTGLHWPSILKQLWNMGLLHLVSVPAFYFQHSGERSADGLGWIWQCNMFGHFALFRSLKPLLSASPADARVIWTSSMGALPHSYDREDWQLLKTQHSYEAVKYQTDLIGNCLDRHALQNTPPDSIKIRHFVSHPGVCATNVSAALVGPFLTFVKDCIFYLVRWLGSPFHPIEAFKGATAAVHLSLVPLVFVTLLSGVNTPKSTDKIFYSSQHLGSRPVRFGSETDRSGNERVGLTEVQEWEEHQEDAEELVDKCNKLFLSLREAEIGGVDSETASERM